VTESDAADRIVREFCAAWANKDPDELVSFFVEDGLWRDMPGPCVIGHAPLRAAFAAAIGKSEGEIRFEIRHQLSDGRVVMQERTDHFCYAGAARSMPACGVFKVRDGRIAAWRDYFRPFSAD